MMSTFLFAVVAFALALALLPLKKLITLYMYITSTALLLTANYCSNLYVEEEKSTHYDGSILEHKESMQRAMVHVVGQVLFTATIAYLLAVNRWILFALSGYLFPIMARACHYPADDLHKVHNFSTLLVMTVVFHFLFHIVPTVLETVNHYMQDVWDGLQLFGYVPYMWAMWRRLELALQFLVFWLVLFSIQLYRHLMMHDHIDTWEGSFVLLLTCMAKCCVTMLSLFGLCVTISYVSNVILTATRFYLQGRVALIETVNLTQQGYTEGFTMFLLALQTGLLEFSTTQRALFMCIVLFIVVSSLVQSMSEIADPILLALGAAQNQNLFKHVRAVSLSTLLWMFPLYMVYAISQFFDMDFWLMVVISSCVLTSVQVIGSLVTYFLFVVDAFGSHPIENLDDFVYYAKATTRFLEFIVAVCVVGFGVRSTLYGDWSIMNVSILAIHCYFNVWQRLTSGWSAYLLRREASAKVGALRDATADELNQLNDICSICYQSMSSAKITHCEHYFHELCLRKWLYVQETCPMCHHVIKCGKQAPGNGAASRNSHASTQTGTMDDSEVDDVVDEGIVNESSDAPEDDVTRSGDTELRSSAGGDDTESAGGSMFAVDGEHQWSYHRHSGATST